MTREDLIDTISDALGDSMGPDWSYATGARYVIDALIAEGVITLTDERPMARAEPHTQAAIDLDTLREMLSRAEMMVPYYQRDVEKRDVENAAMAAAGLQPLHSDYAVKRSSEDFDRVCREAECLMAVIAHFADHEEAMVQISSELAAAPDLLGALKALEPHLDAIVCYASTMDEHEPNRLASNARAAILKAEAA